MTQPKLLFHTQHLLGIGHRVRAHRIALAAADAGFSVTLLEGGMFTDKQTQNPESPSLPYSVYPLPSVRAADAAFSGLIQENGHPVDSAWEEARKDQVLAAFDAIKPDVLLVEGYPFARRRFAFELDPLLAAARTAGIPTACSIRDILVAKKDPKKLARIAAVATAAFDQILVHGDADFAPLSLSFPLASRISEKTVYTGYVVAPSLLPSSAENANPDNAGEVIVSAGGGAVGAAVFETALAARQNGLLTDRPWRFLLGENLPSQSRSLLETANQGIAGASIIIEPARQDFPDLLSKASLSISQAGYNTIMDLAQTRCPAVLIPFEGTGETEQPLRAQLLAAQNLVTVVSEATLSPENLSAAATTAVKNGRPEPYPFQMNGAEQTASILHTLSQSRPSR